MRRPACAFVVVVCEAAVGARRGWSAGLGMGDKVEGRGLTLLSLGGWWM